MTAASRPVEFVTSLERGLAVIRAFDAVHPRRTLSDVARATGLPRAAARRSLITLVELGYVRQDGNLYALRASVLELGYAYLSSLQLPDIAQPHLERLTAAVGHAGSLAVLDGDDAVYAVRTRSTRMMSVTINVGTRFRAHRTALGRVLLAGRPAGWLAGYLERNGIDADLPVAGTRPPRTLAALVDEVRERGHALNDQELEEGVRSLAVPVHGADGSVAAAVNLSVPAGGTTVAALRSTLLPELRATRQAIETDLAAHRAG